MNNKSLISFLVIFLLILTSGCIFQQNNRYGVGTWRVGYEINLIKCNNEGNYTIYLPIPIITDYSSETNISPMKLMYELTIQPENGSLEIVSINSTYFLKIFSEKNFSLSVIKIIDYNKNDSWKYYFEKLSSNQILLQCKMNLSLKMDNYVFEYDDHRGGNRFWVKDIIINEGWQRIYYDIRHDHIN